MNWALHSMFDDNLTNDGATPTLSAYCDTKSPIIDSINGYAKLELCIVFKSNRDADVYAKLLRDGV